MTIGRQSYLVLVALAFVVAALLFVRTPSTLAQMMQTNGSSSGGCSDVDQDGICLENDPCPTLWHVAPSCPDPAGSADLTFEAGPGRPGRFDKDAYLTVWNNSYYEYKVDIGQTSSHAYCPTCDDDVVNTGWGGQPHPPCSSWSGDYANCLVGTPPEPTFPNPKSYGGSDGTKGSISPCAGTAASENLEIGANKLEYHPYNHCCDNSADILFAVQLVIKQYRYVNDTVWRNFPSPLPEKIGWASRHVVDVGFPNAYDQAYRYEDFTVPNQTTPACEFEGENVHYAASSLDTDGDGLPNACDCDDDNDCCLDGDDYAGVGGVFVDKSLNKCERPTFCQGVQNGPTFCSAYKRGFGTYDPYPIDPQVEYHCRGYDSSYCDCSPSDEFPCIIPDPCTP